jgi:hypothetical protein
MFRRIHKKIINLSKNLINFIYLFILFYFRLVMKIFVRATNKYAKKEIELKYREISEFFIHNRYFDWKFLTTKEI